MTKSFTRREFMSTAAAAALATATGCAPSITRPPHRTFKISLAQWSLHRALRAGDLDHLDFARIARQEFDIGAIEFVNTFFKDKAGDRAYLDEMNRRAADNNVVHHLIMCDGEGKLGDPDAAKRKTALENHYRWVDAARQLGCSSIRVNADSEGSPDEQARLCADGLHTLCEYGEHARINILVENHEGLSMNPGWLARVIRMVGHKRIGSLPDFGNVERGYDRYQGMTELVPYAKAVSAKSFDFDDNGNETTLNYTRLMKIVTDAGYHSWVGIEYEGPRLSEREGIRATLRLLQKQLS
jgi:L-ribulose-5-phosphate 3-epimerase